MKLYSVHLKEGDLESAELVREGFYVFAFALPLFWMLYHRLWLPALVAVMLIAIGILQTAGSSEIVLGAISLGIQLVVALNAADLRRWGLGLRGYDEAATVTGRNVQDAERRFFDEYGALPGREEMDDPASRPAPWGKPARTDPLGVFPTPTTR